jgi:co-chaperonin GroES (HSP10)
MADLTKLEALVGCPIHPDVATVKPFGNRLVVMREEVKAFSATCHHCGKRNLTVSPSRSCAYCSKPGLVSLEIPTQARDLPSVGWVVAVGPEATQPNFPRSIPISGVDLLGCKVLFAAYGGYTLNIGEPGETLYEGRYLIIESPQVFALVGEPPTEIPL